MKAAILAIGDELTTGAVTDTNSSWISDRLLEAGVATALHLSVPDDIEDIIDAFRLCAERADQVIVTGGLGPTEDDLTRDAFCRYAGVGTVENELALQKIEAIFKMIGRTMTDNNRKQAHIPSGSEMIVNPIGTAPGFMMEKDGATFYFLPGVPRECEMMMEGTVLPALQAKVRGSAFRIHLFRTFGRTESQLDQDLADLDLPEGVRLGYRATYPEIHIKLIAGAGSAEAAEATLAKAADMVRGRIGEVVYSEDGRPLEEVVLDILRKQGRKLAVAESCTGGLITSRLTDVAGSSDAFDRGFVTYSNRAKVEMLGVKEKTLDRRGAVSSETAIEMAKGALERSSADVAVAVTGIAGPSGGTPEKPVGTVHIAAADKEGVWERRFAFIRADRRQVRELTSQAALEIVRRRILGLGEFIR